MSIFFPVCGLGHVWKNKQFSITLETSACALTGQESFFLLPACESVWVFVTYASLSALWTQEEAQERPEDNLSDKSKGHTQAAY